MTLESAARHHALLAVARSVALHGVLLAAWFVDTADGGARLLASVPVILGVSIGVPLAATVLIPLEKIADRIAAEIGAAPADRRSRNVTEEIAIGLGEQVGSVRTHPSDAVNVVSLPTSTGEVVAATTGAVQRLSRPELQALVAAQFAGMRDQWCRAATRAEIMWWAIRYAIPFSMIGGLITGTTAPLFVGFMLIFVVAFLPRMNEQARDLCADVAAIRLTYHPDALASAMRTIASDPDEAHDVSLGAWWLPVNPFLVLPRRTRSRTSVSVGGNERTWTSGEEVQLEFMLRADRAEALAGGGDPHDYTGREFRRRWRQLGRHH